MVLFNSNTKSVKMKKMSDSEMDAHPSKENSKLIIDQLKATLVFYVIQYSN